jgi:hypothetical protein
MRRDFLNILGDCEHRIDGFLTSRVYRKHIQSAQQKNRCDSTTHTPSFVIRILHKFLEQLPGIGLINDGRIYQVILIQQT